MGFGFFFVEFGWFLRFFVGFLSWVWVFKGFWGL